MSERKVQVLRNASIVLPDRTLAGDLLLRGGWIQALTAAGQGVGEEIWDLAGRRVAPGLIDMHTHGGWGVDFAQDSVEQMLSVVPYYAQHGVTRLLLTLCPAPLPEMLDSLKRAAAACERSSAFVGIHLEGPFLAVNRRGALPAAGIQPYDPDVFDKILRAAGSHLRVMTFAPEAIPAGELRKIQSTGITLSIGHTDGVADDVTRAVRAGVRRATHLCNAMPPIHHRRPGPVIACLTEPAVRVEVIVDGCHLDDRFVDLVLTAKGIDNVLAVSDSMPLAGLGTASGTFASHEVVSDGTRACLPDGTLAGSVTPLLVALQRLGRRLDLPAHRLSRLGSTVPAQDLPVANLGRIATGTPADLIVFDQDEEAVLSTLRGGVRVDAVAEEELAEEALAEEDVSLFPDTIERVQ
ncbi:MAG: amidohydrolase family protein [Planctomycetota bacterium]